MRHLTIVLCIFFGHCLNCKAQSEPSSINPKVNVVFNLKSHSFKYGQDIPVIITLTNKTDSVQNVWFDRPKSSTGGPAWTSVILTNKRTGLSLLKYQNKAILSSQAYSVEQVKKFSYHLKPGEQVTGQFSLYDLVVLLNDKDKLGRGSYEMQILYASNASNKISFRIN